MLDRVQGRTGLRIFGDTTTGVKLSGAQKALAQWSVVDDYNTVLDMSCKDTGLLRHLTQKFSLRACGIAQESEDARMLREALPDAEIFCARKEDIPWRDESFDAVFLQIDKNDADCGTALLKEALRVLKPCGQLLISVAGMPEVLRRAADFLGISDGEEHVRPRDLLKAMEEAGFGDISYRLARPFVGLAMGWKWQ